MNVINLNINGAVVKIKIMNSEDIKSLLFTIYTAGFNHGGNEGCFPEHGIYEAFERLIVGESPTQNNVSYNIKDRD